MGHLPAHVLRMDAGAVPQLESGVLGVDHLDDSRTLVRHCSIPRHHRPFDMHRRYAVLRASCVPRRLTTTRSSGLRHTFGGLS
ncbi:hypothetical protein FM112_08530 [Gulosibacter sp. 10]|nr:hypothetical protein FM112_08530 [Gulosibacter sp. 10]